MMRASHWLRGNKNNEMPWNCLFYDTETRSTYISENEVRADFLLGWTAFCCRKGGGGFFRATYRDFQTVEEFWKIVFSRSITCRKLYVFSHNQAFDFTVVRGFQTLLADGWKVTKAIIEGPPTILSFRKAKHTICFVDTLNYFRQSLKSLGDAIGLEKLTIPEDQNDLDSLSVYCKRDVEIIVRAMQSFMDFVYDNDLGNFQPTLAGQSFAAYRHRFMPVGIFIDNNRRALRLARKSYYGGRTEAFYIGSINYPAHLLDINSQYPSVMKNNEYPNKLIGIYANVTNREIVAWSKRFALCGMFHIKTNIPAFPLRYEKRLIFPTGEFTTFLSTPEILELIRLAIPFQAFHVAVYHKAKLFDEFVDFFYKVRRDYADAGNKAFAHMAKILMNSLYGKFGQSGRVYESVGKTSNLNPRKWSEIDIDSKQVVKYREFAGVIQELRAVEESRDSMPAIAAHITAYARMQLWRLMCICGQANLLYVDTDSLLVNSIGLENLSPHINQTTIGALKHEASFSSGVIYAPKDYKLDDKIRIKGIRPNAVQIEPNVYMQDTFLNFRGMIARGSTDEMVIRATTKQLTREYRKGIVQVDGRITPIHMQSDNKPRC